MFSGANRYPQAHGDSSDSDLRIPDTTWREFFKTLNNRRGEDGDITIRKTIRLITYKDGSWLVMSDKSIPSVLSSVNRGLIEAKARKLGQTVSVTNFDPVKKRLSSEYKKGYEYALLAK